MAALVRAWSILAWLPFAGLAAWLTLAGLRIPASGDEAALAELIVLFMPLVAVPLALPLTARKYRSEGQVLSRQSRRFKVLATVGGIGRRQAMGFQSNSRTQPPMVE
jgi:hypothetical protein